LILTFVSNVNRGVWSTVKGLSKEYFYANR
jgi:hypothetical protein